MSAPGISEARKRNQDIEMRNALIIALGLAHSASVQPAAATTSYYFGKCTRSCKTDYRNATGRIWNSSLQRFVPTWGSICETTCPPGPAGQSQGTPKTIQQLRNIRQF